MTTMTARERKYFRSARVDFSDGNIIWGKMARDGLIFIFSTEIAPYLDKAYKTKDKYGWYFNESKDRYVAEREGDGDISINPSFFSIHAVCVTLGE